MSELLSILRGTSTNQHTSKSTVKKRKKKTKPIFNNVNKALQMFTSKIESTLPAAAVVREEIVSTVQEGDKYYANIKLRNGKTFIGGSNSKDRLAGYVFEFLRKNRINVGLNTLQGALSTEGEFRNLIGDDLEKAELISNNARKVELARTKNEKDLINAQEEIQNNQEKIKKLNKEIAEYREKLSKRDSPGKGKKLSKNDITKYNNQIDELQKQIQKLEDKNRDTEQLRKAVKDSEEIIGRLKHDVIEKDDMINRGRQMLNTLNDEKDRATRERDLFREGHNLMEKHIEKLNSKIHELEDQLRNTRNKSDRADIQKEIDELNKTIRGLTKTNDKHMKDKEELRGKLEQNEQTRRDLEIEIRRLREVLRKAESYRDQCYDDRDALKNKIKEKEKQLESEDLSKRRRTQLQDDFDKLVEEKKQKEKEVREKEGKIKELQNRYDIKLDELDEKQELIDKLEASLTKLQLEGNEDLRKAYDEITERYRSQRSMNDRLTLDYEAMKVEHQKLLDYINRLKKDPGVEIDFIKKYLMKNSPEKRKMIEDLEREYENLVLQNDKQGVINFFDNKLKKVRDDFLKSVDKDDLKKFVVKSLTDYLDVINVKQLDERRKDIQKTLDLLVDNDKWQRTSDIIYNKKCKKNTHN